jgi:hypothetical protein
MDAESKLSHNFGAYKRTMESNDIKIRASPNCVRLYITSGNRDNFELIK